MEKTVHFIMYHYVRDLKNSEYPTIKGLDKELFEKQLAYSFGALYTGANG